MILHVYFNKCIIFYFSLKKKKKSQSNFHPALRRCLSLTRINALKCTINELTLLQRLKNESHHLLLTNATSTVYRGWHLSGSSLEAQTPGLGHGGQKTAWDSSGGQSSVQICVFRNQCRGKEYTNVYLPPNYFIFLYLELKA